MRDGNTVHGSPCRRHSHQKPWVGWVWQVAWHFQQLALRLPLPAGDKFVRMPVPCKEYCKVSLRQVSLGEEEKM
jgi:hypothetical protein